MAEDSRRTLLHAKGNQEGNEVTALQDRRVQASHHPPALSSLADRLWKTTATCAVVTVASSLGEDTNNRVSRN